MDIGDIGESRTVLWRKMKLIAAQYKTKKTTPESGHFKIKQNYKSIIFS